MSVAFRREGDDEHLEPKFELPLPPGPNLVTEAGLDLIRRRVAELEGTIKTLSEETALKAAKRDLRYWQTRLSTAEVQPEPSSETVQFGCRVRITLDGKERMLSLVGHDEAEPAKGRIAFAAPLSRALLGLKVGDFADFNGREDAIEVLEISADR